jgi:hypothetical protein
LVVQDRREDIASESGELGGEDLKDFVIVGRF